MLSTTATVSGSFHRGLDEIQHVVAELTDLGVIVLSPADPRVVDQFGEFVFVASDRHRSIRFVQERHLRAIAASAFVWLVAPDGYVGSSAAMEIGFARAYEVPVFTDTAPNDLTLRQYVQVVRRPQDALTCVGDSEAVRQLGAVLLDPVSVIEEAHSALEVVLSGLVPARIEVAGDTDIHQAADAIRRSLIGL